MASEESKFMNINNRLRQITLRDEDYRSVRYSCIQNDQTLTEFYRHMLDWFFEEYLNDPSLTLQASVKQGKRLSLWIEERQIRLIKTLSDRFKASDARVIYTALVLYLNQ
jgi:hypothetical protein